MRRTVITLISFAATVAAALTFGITASAQAAPHWLAEGKLIGSQTVPVKGRGNLGFRVGINEADCAVKESGTITNPPGGGAGIGEMLTFRTASCTNPADPHQPPMCPSGPKSRPEILALGLPWPSHLAAAESPTRIEDVLEGVQLEARCKQGMSYGVFSGTLVAIVEPGELRFEGRGGLPGASGTLFIEGAVPLRGPHGARKISAG